MDLCSRCTAVDHGCLHRDGDDNVIAFDLFSFLPPPFISRLLTLFFHSSGRSLAYPGIIADAGCFIILCSVPGTVASFFTILHKWDGSGPRSRSCHFCCE
ncbi:hypothetical protein BKA83DRAFT_4263076 [Pisolithus microcarpus]|nr:hypothetical protein BKA83DRAFT_4263076 [Pisolithus microcarpus]